MAERPSLPEQLYDDRATRSENGRFSRHPGSMLAIMDSRYPMPDPEICERAWHARDARFDGRFFIAVKSTRIYCRPVCPAPAARAANVTYYATAAAAAEAGFRPCLRCRPETAPGTPAWLGTSITVARGLRLIGEGALDAGSVDALAERLGVTSRHLSRLFKEHLGASPLTIAQTRRLQFAKRLIDESNLKFADIALAAGFGSLRRFNHATRETWGRSPRELRALRKGGQGSEGDAVTLRIALRPPFDAAHWLNFLATRAIPGVEAVAHGAYLRVHASGSGTGIVQIAPSPDDAVAFVTARGVLPGDLFEIVRRARALLDADADPGVIGETLSRDRALRTLVKKRPGIRLPGAWDPFELSVRAVLGQQISVAAARTIAARLVATFGVPLNEPQRLDDVQLTHLFPAANALRDADFTRIGVPAKRAAALRALAAAVDDNVVDFSLAPMELAERLQALPGIGPWTAQYIVMRALRDPDALPAGDLVVRQMLGHERALSARAVEEHAGAWRPWRAYGLIHLWAKASEK